MHPGVPTTTLPTTAGVVLELRVFSTTPPNLYDVVGGTMAVSKVHEGVFIIYSLAPITAFKIAGDTITAIEAITLSTLTTAVEMFKDLVAMVELDIRVLPPNCDSRDIYNNCPELRHFYEPPAWCAEPINFYE